MLLENNLKKYKEAPEAIKQMVGLVGLTTLIIFTFMFLNIFIVEIKESEKTAESVNIAEIDKVITSLPRGRLNFYESSEGHQLSLSEYESWC
jgi:cell division protein FtsI/penicillin-binding protein 2